MIDLTRLMHEDGAERPVIHATPANQICIFTYRGRRWRMLRVEAEKDEMMELGWSFWVEADDKHMYSEFHISNFLKDPDGIAVRMFEFDYPGMKDYWFDGDPEAFAVTFEEMTE